MSGGARDCSHHPPLPRTLLPSLVTVAARPTSRVSTAVRLPAELHAELQQRAEEREVSVNFLVTRAVAHYLKALGPADPLSPSQGAAT